jgi:predicted ATPase
MQSSGIKDRPGEPPALGENGSSVPAFLDYLLRRDRDRFDRILTALRELVRGIEDLRISTPDPSQRRIELVIENGLEIPGDDASTGVRLMLFFIALAYHPSPPKLILVEEPENGVHPKRLVDVVRLLREITQGKHGSHAAQVILTTHSPYLMDQISPEQDQVLVFRRREDGSRTAEPVDEARLKTFMDEFMLGEVWFNQDEEGLIARH